MREESLRVVIAIGFLLQIIGFLGFGGLLLYQSMEAAHMRDTMIIEFGQAFKDRDERLFKLNNRVATLEKQKDLERRVRDIEKQLRIYCTGTKIEMCGTLGPRKPQR